MNKHCFLAFCYEKASSGLIKPFDAPAISRIASNSSYFLNTIYMKYNLGVGECNYLHLIERAITRVALPLIRPDLKNFGGYGFDNDGNFFMDYYDGTVADYDKKVTQKDFSNSRRIVIKIPKDGSEIEANIIDEWGGKGPYNIKTSANEKDRHTASAAIASMIAYIYLNDDLKDEFSVGIKSFFKDLVDAERTCESVKMFKAMRAIDVDIYSLIAYEEELILKGIDLPLKASKYNKSEIKELNIMEGKIDLKKMVGSSLILSGESIETSSIKVPKKENSLKLKDIVKKGEFFLNMALTNKEKALIPTAFDDFIPDEIVLECAKEIKDSSKCKMALKNILWTGETGTGKTTNAQILSRLLNIPYYSMKLSSDKLSSDILTTCLPNSKTVSSEELESLLSSFPSPMEIALDTDVSYEKITGESKKKVMLEDIYKAEASIILDLTNKMGDFMYVDSPFVKAFRNGGLIELQECNSAKASILKSLNEALDDLGIIHLPTGEVVKRNPNCIVIVTANIGSGYRGIEAFSNDFIARFQEADIFTLPDDDTLIERVVERTGYENRDNIKKMIDVMYLIQKELLDIRGDYGTCSPRALFSWARATKNSGSPYKAGLKTIIGLSSQDPDERSELIGKMEMYFSKSSIA